MKRKIYVIILIVGICNLLTKTAALGQTITSCTVVFITPDCDGCDNKDHDTKIRISVFGSYGQEVASTYYTQDMEFNDDGSEHSVSCTVTNSNGGSSFAQKIIVSIEPNGDDDWYFEARVIFGLSNGSAVTTNMQGRMGVSSGNPTAILWAR